MPYIGESVHLVGYRVRIERRAAFRVRGYTRIVPPGRAGEGAIPTFWRDVAADGRLARLVGASVVRPWVLDLGSWDPECEHGGQRYTICIEETPHTDFSGLERGGDLHSQEIGASGWMCFEIARRELAGGSGRITPTG